MPLARRRPVGGEILGRPAALEGAHPRRRLPTLKKVLGAVALVILAFLGYVATRPGTYTVARSTVVAAPPDAVYPPVADFRRWAEWSPWEKLDPAMRKD